MTDKHYTTSEVAAAIVRKLVQYGDLIAGDRVLDPSAGKGVFLNACRCVENVSTVSIDDDASVNPDILGDFRTVALDQQNPFNLIVTNPPFTLAQEFVERAHQLIDPRGTIAFLLLLQFLGSKGRKGFFETYPPSTIDILRPRPSFAENGQTDMREYALFRWVPQDKGCPGFGRIGFIDWEKPSRRAVNIPAALAAE